jgi:predicted nucleic acid-binding protein
MELVQGLRNKEELNVLRNSLKGWNAEIIYINEEISIKAMFLVEQYYLSHSIQLADALIGAAAMIYGLPLLTANTKHYTTIKNIILKKFRP